MGVISSSVGFYNKLLGLPSYLQAMIPLQKKKKEKELTHQLTALSYQYEGGKGSAGGYTVEVGTWSSFLEHTQFMAHAKVQLVGVALSSIVLEPIATLEQMCNKAKSSSLSETHCYPGGRVHGDVEANHTERPINSKAGRQYLLNINRSS